MAKKKKGLAAFKSKAKAIKEVVRSKSNPPPMTDLAEFIAPGFVGYAGTRFTSRAIHSVVIKRWPKLAKHASVLSTFGAGFLAYYLVHRIKKIEKYHTPVVVGAGIAALQTLTQAYLPKYGWLVSDHNLHQGAQLEAPAPLAPTPGVPQVATSGFTTSGVNLPPPLFRTTPLSKAAPIDELSDLDMEDMGSLGGTDIDGDGLSDDDIDEILMN